MKELMAIVTISVFFGTIYKIFELFIRRSERMKLIDRLSESPDPQSLHTSLFAKSSMLSNKTAIKIASLLIGMAVGLLGVFAISYADFMSQQLGYSRTSFLEPNIEILSLGFVLFFGGLGLLIPSIIFYKQDKK